MRYSKDSLEGRLQAGDAEAVGVVSRWIAIVLTSSRFWALRRDWPDLHQEVLTRVLTNLKHEHFDSRGDLRLYVQAIARYTALRALRASPPWAWDERSSLHDESIEADQKADVRARLLVGQVLLRLSTPCRFLVTSYFLEQRGYEEIAAELDLPVGTVKSRLFRCLEAAHRVIASASGSHRRSSRSRAGTRQDQHAKPRLPARPPRVR